MVLVFLLKIIFFVVTTISNLVSRIIFATTAYLLVLLIHKLRVPGEAVHEVLEQVVEAIRGFTGYLFELIAEATKTVVSNSFDLLKGSVTESAGATSSAIWGLLEKTRASLDEKLKHVPEVLEGFAEMVSSVVAGLWNSCREALTYVTENA